MENMKPTLGRIVLALVDPAINSGQDVCPAVVTRVWTDVLVNVVAFTEQGGPRTFTSRWLYATEDEARHGSYPSSGCFWPKRG